MREIALSNGMTSLVDDEDFIRCTRFRWCVTTNKGGDPYASRGQKINGVVKSISLSRFIMGVTNPKLVVDHINHDTLDNRKENLRVCTHRQNMQNLLPDHYTSKFPGVCWMSFNSKWQATILLNGKRKYLGQFDDEREAAKAYEAAVRATGEELVCKMHRSVPA